ncbi:MAG TPA: phospho-N-acetylmuramoyl-pentapeptide-transferase [Acidimicrobiales bacterium]|nr:phospho-N-acetylmuramoyl-pentapeptide-transferase [Acidimicrobiales bacterium]
MIALLVAGGVALVVALGATPVYIRWLQSRGIGQQIREDGPQGHVTKAGTPTMGGLMIVAGALAGYLAGHLREGAIFTRGGLLVAVAVAGAGLVGLLDDWIKVRHQRSLGLNKRAKVAGQLVVAGGFAVLALNLAKVNTDLAFTRWDSLGLDLGPVGWTVLAVLMIIGTSNAVNLTDGLDGLAAGASTFAFSAFAIIGFWQFRHFDVYQVPQALDLALLAVAMTGACAGFLWWNAAPARIFMGDTGSLAIGAGLAALALVMNLHLLLPVIGGLYVLETLSVMVQVASFRFFHRRVFRMAPVHHHFELLGWPETTVIVRFWILAGLCTAFALGLFYADFISIGGVD